MGRKQNLAERLQWMVKRKRLILEHVQSCSRKPSLSYGGGQRNRINHCSPGGVNQVCRALHPTERGSVHHVPCAGSEWGMQANHVRTFQKLAQRSHTLHKSVGLRQVSIRIVSTYLHPETIETNFSHS